MNVVSLIVLPLIWPRCAKSSDDSALSGPCDKRRRAVVQFQTVTLTSTPSTRILFTQSLLEGFMGSKPKVLIFTNDQFNPAFTNEALQRGSACWVFVFFSQVRYSAGPELDYSSSHWSIYLCSRVQSRCRWRPAEALCECATGVWKKKSVGGRVRERKWWFSVHFGCLAAYLEKWFPMQFLQYPLGFF